MTTYRVILANTVQEGNAYAREQGFRPGSFRVAPRAAAIRGLREAEVHELPSFDLRMDRFAIHSELRYNRGPHFRIDEGWTWTRIDRGDEQPELPFDTSVTISGGPVVITKPADEPAEIVEAAQESTKVGVQLSPEEFARLTAELEEPAEVVPALGVEAREVLSEPTPKRPNQHRTAVDKRGVRRPVANVIEDL